MLIALLNPQNNGTILLLACESRSLAMLRAVLSHSGLDVNYRRERDGETALLLLVKGGSSAMVRHLLSYGGVDCNLANKDGTTALMRACESDLQASTIPILLEQEQLNVGMQNKSGELGDSFL
eukprot:gene3419-3754_t